MGTPEFAVTPLEQLCLKHYQVVAVYTQPDRPAGRGRSLVPSPVKEAALVWDLPVIQPDSLKEAEVVAQLSGFRPDIIVVAAFGQILPQAVLDIPRYGCLNLHPSLLPRFRGASPVAAALLAGDESTGVSIMLMDSGLDTGPVLARKRVKISPQENTGSLTSRLSRVAAKLLPEVLVSWTKGEITPQPQNETEATYSKALTKREGEIDWQWPAIEIWRQVRACQPWPGGYTRWQGRRLAILEAVPLSGEEPLAAGQVMALNREGVMLGVTAGEGILGVLRLQLEGRRAMPASEFLKGQRQIIGAVLPD